jgi:phage shock protein C
MPLFHSPRKLKKVPDRKRIAGVCAGFAYWLSVEVWFMRLMWILLIFVNGIGLFAYILFWMVLPKWENTPQDFDEATGD